MRACRHEALTADLVPMTVVRCAAPHGWVGAGSPTVGSVSQPPRPPRRAPRIGPFLVTGGVIGLIAGFLISVLGPATSTYGAAGEIGFIGLGCTALGVLLGGIAFVLLDRRA